MGLNLGLDIGSTSIKAIIYDIAGNCVSIGASDIPLAYTDAVHQTWSVWEPDEIWNRILISIRKALNQIPSAGDVDAIAVTGFGMDGLPIDQNGIALYPFISWHCMRTLGQYERFKNIVDEQSLFHETGKQAMFIDSIYRMMWMNENHPEIMEKANKWLLIEDYVNFLLCGEIATDYSMGSTTSALKPDTHTWSEMILRSAGIPAFLFPKPMQSGTVLGEVLPEICKQTGLKRGTKVVLGGHDYVCAAFALGVVDERDLMDITGTWEMMIRGCRKLDLSPSLAQRRYYIEGHVVAGSYCQCISNVSGDMTEWFKRQFSTAEKEQALNEGKSVWNVLMQEAKNSPIGSHGCTFLPHFSGSNAPVSEATSLGAYVGLHNLVTKEDMLRATLEGLTYKMKEMLDSIVGNDPQPDKIITTGGAARNNFWMQMKADVTGIPIEVPEVVEATSLGAALLAGLGTGQYKNEEEAIQAVCKKSITFEPDRTAHEKYLDLYQNVYGLLQPSLSSINARIHKRFIEDDA